MKLLQSRAFLLGYVVMVRDRRFELRITRARTGTIPDVSLSRMLPASDSNTDNDAQNVAAFP